ncbi:phage scaffolding protein [Fructilactobacillus vespulae]|uniref:phage scaffolding protein n=1 Tax=Fructilactobacillus vespulae TaxID=1249630 RepID=UPI0039B62049
MKREDLRSLGLNDEQVDNVMKSHHQEIDNLNAKVTDLTTERDQLNTQLGERDKDLKKLQKNSKDNEELSSQLTEMKTKYDADKQKWESNLAKTKLNGAIDAQLGQTKARDTEVIKKLIDLDSIKLGENGKVDGLQNQIDQLAKDKPYLFEGNEQQHYNPQDGEPNVKNSFADALGIVKSK